MPNDRVTLGINPLGIRMGEIVNHDEIHAIKLLENNRIIHF
jgi:hypothetical protein